MKTDAAKAMTTRSSLSYAVMPVTQFQQNCSLIWCDHTRAAVVIDPGGEAQRLQRWISRLRLHVRHVVLTHGHLDHAGVARELADQLSVDVIGPHPDDEFLLSSLQKQGDRYGVTDARDCVPDRWLQAGEKIACGSFELEAFHCPGHTPGHMVLVERRARVAWVGDVLFNGSVGRSDLPRGNGQALIEAIREQLFPLGDDIVFISGHGPLSTFGRERMTNPFVADLNF